MLTKIRSYVLILFFASYVAGLTVIAIVLGSFITVTSVSHAQMFPNIQNANTVTTNPALTLPEREHLVKIISPIKGQQVPVGKDLTISGTSADNTRSSDCKVSVIVNGDKPYRNAYPIGQAGSGDNSKWNFTLTPP
jgi:hypothetical protein